jgi:acyl-CoA synthetase (AMP-forming)/AMP-acid ligase II
VHPAAHAATDPTKPAVIMAETGETITYAELDERSIQLARLLASRGLRPGDRVAIFAENHPRWFEVIWAALRSGLYLVTVNRHLSAEEAAYIVQDSEAQVLITSHHLAGVAHDMLAHIPECEHRLMFDGRVVGFESYEDAVGAQPTEPLAEQPRGDMMLYSSGTTGRPKGIKRALRDLQVDDPAGAGMSLMQRYVLGMDETSVFLSPAPMYHAAPIHWTIGVQELGATVVLMGRFDPEGYLAAVQRYGVTHSQVVPTMMIRMLALPESVRSAYDMSTMKGLVHAAAPCPPEAKRQMIEWLGPVVNEYYSGTEGGGLTYITSEEWLAHPGSVGKPFVGVLHICAEDGTELGPGEIGSVYFGSDTEPFEYHGDPAKTAESRHPDNRFWTTLGDVGYVDEEGYLYLTDRKSFMIISGGVNIYPAEIESVLIMHPKVADVAVFGLPDPEMGEFVQAVVQTADGVVGDDALVDELKTYGREHLAGYKIPRVIDFRDELPRLPTGKLYKRELRDEYLEAAGA